MTTPTRATLLASLVALLASRPALSQTDSTWRDHNRAADAATRRRDWPEARTHLLAMDRLLGGHPAVPAALALVAVRSGDTAEALAQLQRVADMGVVSQAPFDTAFDGVRGLPAFQRIARAIAASASKIGVARVAATLPDSDDIAEDLAYDAARRRFIVSSVRRHRLTAVAADGRATGFGDTLPAGWGVLAVGVDAPRNVVWLTTVTLPQAAGYVARDSGHSAILRLDLRTGTILRRFDLPAPSRAAPGDLGIASNGDVFFGDGQTGAIRVIRAGRDSLETLVPEGRLHGTQQPAVAPDGRSLFIADYGRGVARIDRASGAVTWLDHPAGVTLTGIDGLTMAGGALIAVQNGVTPNRVVRLTLDAGATAVTRARILLRDTGLAPEPTHAIVVGGALYLIGNAGWVKYGDDGTRLPEMRGGARILRMELTAGR